MLSEQERASCVDKQTLAELNAGFFSRSMTTPRRLCTSRVPSTHSSFSVAPRKSMYSSKRQSIKDVASLCDGAFSRSHHAKKRFSSHHCVPKAARCLANLEMPFERKESVVFQPNYTSNQIVHLVSSGHNFGFPAPISKRKPPVPPVRRTRELSARLFFYCYATNRGAALWPQLRVRPSNISCEAIF